LSESKALAVVRGQTGCVTVKIDKAMRCKLVFEKGYRYDRFHRKRNLIAYNG